MLYGCDDIDVNVTAASDMIVGELSKYHFEALIGGAFQDILKANTAEAIIRKVHLFSSLDPITQVIPVITSRTVNSCWITPESGIYIVKRGTVKVFWAGKFFKYIAQFDYFGERSILGGEPSQYTFSAQGKVLLWFISKPHFESIMNEEIKQRLEKRVQLEDNPARLEELIVIKLLGSGIFSNVFLVSPS